MFDEWKIIEVMWTRQQLQISLHTNLDQFLNSVSGEIATSLFQGDLIFVGQCKYINSLLYSAQLLLRDRKFDFWGGEGVEHFEKNPAAP